MINKYFTKRIMESKRENSRELREHSRVLGKYGERGEK